MDILCNNINCNGIGMRRADWDNFRECERIMLNGQQIWGYPLSDAVRSRIYEDIVTTGHHSASLAAEVWRAANAYCKAHKSAHPELTEQGKLLSNFVNADPDLYCSLPLTATPEALSAMPKRVAISTGTQYINLNMTITKADYCKVGFIPTILSGQGGYIGVAGENSSPQMGYNAGGWNCGNASSNRPYMPQIGRYFTYEWGNGQAKFLIDGQDTGLTRDGTFTCKFFYCEGTPKSTSIDLIYVIKNGTIYHYIPCKIDGVVEFMNLDTLTLATRVGTFTEQKDIPIS